MEITRIPAGSLGSEDLAQLAAEVAGFDRLINEESGLGPDFDPRVASVRTGLATATPYTTREYWIAREGGAIVAKGLAYLSLQDNLDLAEVELAVRPDRRRRGLGTAVADRIDTDLGTAGRTNLVTFNDVSLADCAAAGEAGQLTAASGFGSLPRRLAAVEFLLGRGFEFKQLERCSLARTDAAAGIDIAALEPDCAIITWTGPTPQEHLRAIAELQTKMSTDTPGAAELMDEELWNAERVRAHDRERAEMGQTMHVALALRGGEAAGFTEVAAFADRPHVGWQGATLVAAAHRGHRLGAHLKIANHRALGETTAIQRIYTWNAVENSWMLRINDASGFETFAWTGLWKKTGGTTASAGR